MPDALTNPAAPDAYFLQGAALGRSAENRLAVLGWMCRFGWSVDAQRQGRDAAPPLLREVVPRAGRRQATDAVGF